MTEELDFDDLLEHEELNLYEEAFHLDMRTQSPSSLADWVTRGSWKFYPHLQIIEREFLSLIFTDEVKFLILSVPPQHGKSEYLSGWGLKWLMGKFPTKRVALTSYAATIAKKWGESARDFFVEFGNELFGLQISPSKKAADNWIFDKALFDSFEDFDEKADSYTIGSMVTTGTGGPLTGQPVDFGIIDDPIKNAADANSPAFREKLKRWFSTVFMTRLSNTGKAIIIATRWHEDDLSGWLQTIQEVGGEKVKVINLPAICPSKDEVPAEEHGNWFPDPLGRSPGDALCPDLHPIDQLRSIEATMTSHDFWALYQGSPRPGKGDWIDPLMMRFWNDDELIIAYDPHQRCWYYKDPEDTFDICLQSWDTKFARKSGGGGSYVVGQVWGLKGSNAYLLFQVRDRWGVEDTIDQVHEVTRLFPMAQLKYFEEKASGPEIVRRLNSQIQGLCLSEVDGDKLVRAKAQQYWFRGRNVIVPRRERYVWVAGMLSEWYGFPHSVYNDQVDAATQALKEMGALKGATLPQRAKKKVDVDPLNLGIKLPRERKRRTA